MTNLTTRFREEPKNKAATSPWSYVNAIALASLQSDRVWAVSDLCSIWEGSHAGCLAIPSLPSPVISFEIYRDHSAGDMREPAIWKRIMDHLFEWVPQDGSLTDSKFALGSFRTSDGFLSIAAKFGKGSQFKLVAIKSVDAPLSKDPKNQTLVFSRETPLPAEMLGGRLHKLREKYSDYTFECDFAEETGQQAFLKLLAMPDSAWLGKWPVSPWTLVSEDFNL